MEKAHSAIRYIQCSVILALALISFYALCLRLISQFHYHRANNLIRERHYGLAVSHLENALRYQPNDADILRMSGTAYHQLGVLMTDIEKSFLWASRAKHAYQRARQLNPFDAEAVYGLAEEEARLEQLEQIKAPENAPSPFNALSFFKEAIHLRPNSIQYHYALALYLSHHDNEKELLTVVRSLCRIYPPAYYYFKRESFWNPRVQDSVLQGLVEAIKDGNAMREAHKAVSSILEGEGRWPQAIRHYHEALGIRVFENREGDFFHLGQLYLKNGENEKASTYFLKGLDLSRSRDKDLERLYNVYKNEDRAMEFYRFYNDVRRRFITSLQMDILLARSLIDLEKYHQAHEVLVAVNNKEPTAEAYYWLARIYEIDSDWDRMELAIQKASILDPMNSHYHMLFSTVLKRLGKLERAEKEATLALKDQGNPSPWFFNHRGWIRWGKKDYKGAAEDWQRAIQLLPDRAAFYAQTAEAHYRLGNLSLSLDYYRDALERDPQNRDYRKRYAELEKLQF
jgi:tetratricopeptide (TPR) repeat protein